MLTTLSPVVAIVVQGMEMQTCDVQLAGLQRQAHARAPKLPEWDAQLTDLQQRADIYVSTLRKRRDVERYEIERAQTRQAAQLPPVPLTKRGRRLLADRYEVDSNGCLILG